MLPNLNPIAKFEPDAWRQAKLYNKPIEEALLAHTAELKFIYEKCAARSPVVALARRRAHSVAVAVARAARATRARATRAREARAREKRAKETRARISATYEYPARPP